MTVGPVTAEEVFPEEVVMVEDAVSNFVVMVVGEATTEATMEEAVSTTD